MLGFKRNNMFAKMQLRYEPLPLPVRTNIGDQEMHSAAATLHSLQVIPCSTVHVSSIPRALCRPAPPCSAAQ